MALTQDYLMRQILALAGALRQAMRARLRGDDVRESELAAEAIGIATGMEPETLLRLEPATFASMLELCAVDDSVADWVAAALEVQAAQCLRTGDERLASLRSGQAVEVRRVFGCSSTLDELFASIPDEPGDSEG